MGKVAVMLLIMTGLMLLFYFGGLIEDTINSDLLNMLLKPADIPSPEFSFKENTLLVLEGLALGGAIVIGVLIRNVQLAVMAAIGVYFFNLTQDFLKVFDVVYAANAVIAILIFGPLMFIFLFSIVEWWRGTD